ncbi:hypothetical protein BpHYR1_049993 [Brachionus plicatilis]|uniref:Uncharacterized protein n=1 Tax=Brachionus plicatilis TaxID=10195 RepID=A0A3M7QY24_BRAPC|nr:hypothetical protein BpHYR1_049993 [Brachionus plicatilis]
MESDLLMLFAGNLLKHMDFALLNDSKTVRSCSNWDNLVTAPWLKFKSFSFSYEDQLSEMIFLLYDQERFQCNIGHSSHVQPIQTSKFTFTSIVFYFAH